MVFKGPFQPNSMILSFVFDLMSSEGPKGDLLSIQGHIVQQWCAVFLAEWATSFSANFDRHNEGRPNHTRN